MESLNQCLDMEKESTGFGRGKADEMIFRESVGSRAKINIIN